MIPIQCAGEELREAFGQAPRDARELRRDVAPVDRSIQVGRVMDGDLERWAGAAGDIDLYVDVADQTGTELGRRLDIIQVTDPGTVLTVIAAARDPTPTA